MSGLTVYALVAGETSAPSIPLEPGLRLVPCGELLAVVGETEWGAATPEALATHDALVRRLAGRFEALLPARFGERVRGEEELAGLLGPRTRPLAEALERVRGCAQMTLRVFGEALPEPVAAFPEASGASTPGTRYLEARRRDLERSRSLPEIEPLLEILRPILRGERIERRGQGRLLGSAYHLVKRDDVEAYRRAVQDSGPRLGGRKVAFSGPWPPYAFAPGLGDPV